MYSVMLVNEHNFCNKPFIIFSARKLIYMGGTTSLCEINSNKSSGFGCANGG